jgi:hypothetical protein
MVNCRSGIGPCTVVIVTINVIVANNLKTIGIDGLALSQQRPQRHYPRPPKVRVHRRKETEATSESSSTSTTPSFPQWNDDGNSSNRIVSTQSQHNEESQDSTFLSDVSFLDRREDFHPLTLRALTEGMGLRTMTQIQTRTLGPALEGKSIIARSGTGSGKTLVRDHVSKQQYLVLPFVQ